MFSRTKNKAPAPNSLRDVGGSITTQVVGEDSDLAMPRKSAGLTQLYQPMKFRRKCWDLIEISSCCFVPKPCLGPGQWEEEWQWEEGWGRGGEVCIHSDSKHRPELCLTTSQHFHSRGSHKLAWTTTITLQMWCYTWTGITLASAGLMYFCATTYTEIFCSSWRFPAYSLGSYQKVIQVLIQHLKVCQFCVLGNDSKSLNYNKTTIFWGSHGSDCEELCLLECNIV
jgi:hypothetical protein